MVVYFRFYGIASPVPFRKDEAGEMAMTIPIIQLKKWERHENLSGILLLVVNEEILPA